MINRVLTKKQFAFISGTILITVLLFFAPRTSGKLNDVKTLTSEHAGNNHIENYGSAKNYLDSSLLALKTEERLKVKFLEDQFSKAVPTEKLKVVDKLVSLFDSLRKPAAAAYYVQEKAKQTGDLADWTKAGDRYYVGSKYFPNANVLIDSAMKAYNRVLEKDPGNLNVKTSLGVCFVEGTGNPMQGITLLQEVLKVDSNYVDALLSLGNFAMTSGQYEKAITRFNKVLRLRPDYILLYLRIAEAYEQTGDKQRTIEYLEKYVKSERDVMLRNSIQNEINKLKNS